MGMWRRATTMCTNGICGGDIVTMMIMVNNGNNGNNGK
jgi:hypothetical protein